MMAAAARMSGTTLPASSVRYRGVRASVSAFAERAALARAARMRAARARALAVADSFFFAGAAAAAASGAGRVTGVGMVVAPAPVARRLTPSHRTVRRVTPRKVLLIDTIEFSKCFIGILAKHQERLQAK